MSRSSVSKWRIGGWKKKMKTRRGGMRMTKKVREVTEEEEKEEEPEKDKEANKEERR